MKRMLGIPLLFLGLAGMSAISVHAALSGDPVIDPLDRPAHISVRAKDALLTSVTRAGSRLVAVGERGTILLSDDNGQNWNQAKQVPTSVLLTSVKFGSPNVGWATGHSGIVLSTTDGGTTWQRQMDGNGLAKVAVASIEPIVKAKGSDPLVQRLQADVNRLSQDGADKPFLDLLVESEREATAVGAFGLAVRTTDGGKSWHLWQPEKLMGKGSHLYGIATHGNAIYIAGEQGSLFRSADNGATLKELEAPYKGSFFGLAVLSPNKVVAYGLRGNVYETSDAGESWRAVKSGTPVSVTAGAVLADKSLLMATQAGSLLRSVDQGQTVSTINPPNPVPAVGMAQAADGSIILAGVRGASRISLNSLYTNNGAK